MADEVVGSARIRIEPDTTGFESALLGELTSALDEANSAFIASFRDAITQVNDAVSAIGGDGFDSLTSAAETSAQQLELAFESAAGSVVSNLESAAAAGDSAFEGLGTGAGDAIVSEFDGVGDAIAAEVEAGADQAEVALDGIGSGAGDTITSEFSGVGDLIGESVTSGAAQAETGLNTLQAAGEGVGEAIIEQFKNVKAVIVAAVATAGIASAFGAAERVQSIAQTTNQLVETTGGVAKITANEIRAMGDAIEQTTNFESELVQESANIILTFKNVRNEGKGLNAIFDRAITASGDLATVLGGDLSGSSLQLGKALQDPVRGVNALRRAGVDFTVQQREQIKTLVESGDILSAQKIVLAEVESQVGGTAEAAAKASVRIKNLFGNLAEEFGLGLLPAAEQLADKMPSIIDDLLPDARRFGEGLGSILTVLVDTGIELLPVLTTTVDLLAAAVPIVELVGDAVDAIPAPILEAAAALFVFARGIKLLTAAGQLSALTRLAVPAGAVAGAFNVGGAAAAGMGSKIAGLGAGLAAMNPLVLIGGLGVAAFAVHANLAAAEEARFRKEVDELTQALTDQDGQIRLSVAGLATYIEESSRFESKNQLDDLSRLGLSYEATGVLAQRGAVGLNEFAARGVAVGELTELLVDESGRLVDAQGNVVGSTLTMTSSFGAVVNAGGRYVVGNTSLITSLAELQRVEQEAAEARVITAVSAGDATQAQVDSAIATATAKDGTIDYAKALLVLQPILDRNARVAEHALTVYGPLAKQFIDTGEALDRLQDSVPKVAGSIAALRSGGLGTDRAFFDMAITLGAVMLSEEEMGDAAALLGTDVETLTGFVKTATDALDSFVDTAVSKLPTVADAFAETASEAADLAGARGTGITDAASDRSKAIREGSTDQAQAIKEGADERAEAIIKAADAEADAIEKAARSGHNTITADAELERAKAIREAAKEQVEALKESAADQADAIREGGDTRADAVGEAAKREADAISKTGKITAAALAKNLLEQVTEIANFTDDLDKLTIAGFADLAGLIAQQGPEVAAGLADELVHALETGHTEVLTSLRDANDAYNRQFKTTAEFFKSVIGPEFILQAGLLGAGITSTFGEGLDFSERIRIAAELAKSTLPVEGQAIAAIAATEGERAARDYGLALDLDQKTVDEAVKAGIAIGESAPTGAARGAGESVGVAFGEGMIFGMRKKELETAFAAQGLVGASLIAARKLAGIGSPSRLFADEIGMPIAEGIALGIEDGANAVVRAAESIVRDAAASLRGSELAVDVTTRATPSGAGGTPTLAAAMASGPSGVQPGDTVIDLIKRVGSLGSGPLIGTMQVMGAEPEATAQAVVSRLRRVQSDLMSRT